MAPVGSGQVRWAWWRGDSVGPQAGGSVLGEWV